MGGERASKTRQRLAGKICCNCSCFLSPAERPGERRCDRCATALTPKKRVYMHFMLREGWHCQFLEEDLKTSLPRKLNLQDEQKIFDMAERGGFRMNLEGRQAIELAVQKGRGGIWLELTAEQYEKLKNK